MLASMMRVWCNAGVFKNVYEDNLGETILSEINSTTILTCFIDATLIENRNGIDLIGFGENRKKKATKLTAICNEQQQILDIICEYNHDANMVLPIVSKILEKIKFRKMNTNNHLFICGFAYANSKWLKES